MSDTRFVVSTVLIDETTARMAAVALRERASNERKDARSRRYTGPQFKHVRDSIRKNAALYERRADFIEAQIKASK